MLKCLNYLNIKLVNFRILRFERLDFGIVNNIICKLSGWNFLVKHDIQLLKTPIGSFRQSEIYPHTTNGGKGGKNESGFTTQIAIFWIQHVRQCDGGSNEDESLDCSSKSNRLTSEFSGRNLSIQHEA